MALAIDAHVARRDQKSREPPSAPLKHGATPSGALSTFESALMRSLRGPRTLLGAIEKMGPLAATEEILSALAPMMPEDDQIGSTTFTTGPAARAVHAMSVAAAKPRFLSRLVKMLGHKTMANAAAAAVEWIGAPAATDAFLEGVARVLERGSGDRIRPAFRAVATVGRAAATPRIVAQLRLALLGDKGPIGDAAASVLGQMAGEGLRFFADASGNWIARRVEELAK